MPIVAESGVKVAEDVSPPPGSVPTASLPLVFFDIKFIGSFPFQRLFFYEFHRPSSYFYENTLPSLKTSLSLTLQRFFPYAGSLVFPPPPQIPYILYTEGDSIPFLVDESAADFGHLVGEHARRFRELQALLPELPPAVPSGGKRKTPLMAVQVTLFPNQGISIGISFCHVAGDGRTLADFVKTWASLQRSQAPDFTRLNQPLPDFHSRSLIEDHLGLTARFMNQKWNFDDLSSNPIDKLHVTYNIKKSQVEFLKELAKKSCNEENESEPTIRISTFVVTCAYMWVCLTKLQGTLPDDSDDVSYFFFTVDCRRHLKLPATYFGNCVIARNVAAKRSELIGEDGFIVAAKAIGREVAELEKGPLEGIRPEPDTSKTRHPPIMVVSSPQFRLYEVDFGWGRPRKTEVASLGSMVFVFLFSIAESREEEGGIELGLALNPHELDSFNAILDCGFFNQL